VIGRQGASDLSSHALLTKRRRETVVRTLALTGWKRRSCRIIEPNSCDGNLIAPTGKRFARYALPLPIPLDVRRFVRIVSKKVIPRIQVRASRSIRFLKARLFVVECHTHCRPNRSRPPEALRTPHATSNRGYLMTIHHSIERMGPHVIFLPQNRLNNIRARHRASRAPVPSGRDFPYKGYFLSTGALSMGIFAGPSLVDF